MNQTQPIDFHRLRVFYLVARCASFSRAAEALYTSQPNVSRHVAKLEAELGAPLFHRLPTSVALTDAGALLYDYAQRVFELTGDLRRALRELEGLERGTLRLAASSTAGLYLLPPLIAAFQRSYPGVEISLDLGNSERVPEQLLAHRADLGFAGGPIAAPGLQVHPYTQDELVLVTAPGHRLAGRSPLTPAHLADETLVLREEGAATRQVVEEALSRLRIAPARLLVMHGCEGVKRAVAAGLGVAFVSRHAVELELAHGLLRVLPGEALALPYPLSIVSHKDRRPAAVTLAFLAHVRKQTAFPAPQAQPPAPPS